MNKIKLFNNIVDQVKEAQIKLGYVRETIRLYYQPASLNALLETNYETSQELCDALEYIEDLSFSVCDGRVEVRVLPKLCEYIHREVKSSPFLEELIALFYNKHNCTIDEVCVLFGKYGTYVCDKMLPGSEFDYVVYFDESEIDEYYYCIKIEDGHSIYHRFIETDYKELLK